jgi:hypothetical protein
MADITLRITGSEKLRPLRNAIYAARKKRIRGLSILS